MNKTKGKVCVTGASGYLASWLVKHLLLEGYHVVGTVRDPENEKKLRHLWEMEGAEERLRLVRVELMQEGSFDEAIIGCDGVFHTASPVLSHSSHPQEELLKPAIEGTLNVLRSCKKNPSLRRVVLTSSSSAARVRYDLDPNVPIDESSWTDVQLCERLQKWYASSKTLAEQAAWEFSQEHGLDLLTVLPAFVVGPSLPHHLSSTPSDILHCLKGDINSLKWPKRMGYVHIDDVARAHILVYEHEAARGRYLCSSVVVGLDELLSFLSARYPSLPIPKRFEKVKELPYDYDTSKIKSLGLKFKSLEEMFDDCVASLYEQGHL